MRMPKPSTWSRKRKVLAGVGGFAIAGMVGVALAMILARGEFTGSGNINPSTVELVISNATVQTETNVDCVASATGGDANIQLVDAVAGGTCTVLFAVNKTDSGTAVLRYQDVRYADDVVDTWFMNGHCGQVVDPVGDGIMVRFTVQADETATRTFTADTDAGIYATDTFNPATCPSGA